MDVFISSFKSAFFYLISIASFDHFILLILLGIIFLFKDWKNYLCILLFLFLGSVIGLLLTQFGIIKFDISTRQLVLAIAFGTVGVHHLIFQNFTNNTLRYNFFSLIGICYGIGLTGHFNRLYGSHISFFNFSGYAMGKLSAYFLISGLSILLSNLLLRVLKTDRRSYELTTSGIAIGMAIMLIYSRF